MADCIMISVRRRADASFTVTYCDRLRPPVEVSAYSWRQATMVASDMLLAMRAREPRIPIVLDMSAH